MKLYFFINKNKLTRQDDEIVTSFSKYYNKCYFKCDKLSENIYKYALFIDALGNQEIQDLGIGKYTHCIIPEKTLESNYFSVSVFGDNRFTTTQEVIIIERSGFDSQTQSLLESHDDESIEEEVIIKEDERFFWEPDYNYRRNRFEIEEHPYTMD